MPWRTEAKGQAGEDEADSSAPCGHGGDGGATGGVSKLWVDEDGVDLLGLVEGGIGERLVEVCAVRFAGGFI